MSDPLPRLTAAGWRYLVLDRHAEAMQEVVERLTSGYVDPLAEPLLYETQDSWCVLETGSGWGSLSATLALRGRRITLMDWNSEIVNQGMRLLRACDVFGTGVGADLYASLPFADKSFDCVWSSGVLEHFPEHEQIRILHESARVARHRVISLVPNAYSLAYRLGKWHMERNKTWEFGYERPEYSQRHLFETAGIRFVRETTVHAARSAWFLTGIPGGEWLQRMWLRSCQIWPQGIHTTARQGYMLVTVGDVS